MDLFDLAALRADLEAALGPRVDVLTLGGLTPAQREKLVAESLVL